jgi:hypothetical protein
MGPLSNLYKAKLRELNLIKQKMELTQIQKAMGNFWGQLTSAANAQSQQEAARNRALNTGDR